MTESITYNVTNNDNNDNQNIIIKVTAYGIDHLIEDFFVRGDF